MEKLKLNIQYFASSNHTIHYDLSQYTANDKPTYLVDYNGDMAKIDLAIYGVETKALENESKIGIMTNLNTTEKASLVGAINEVNTQVGTNTTNIGTNTSDILANSTKIGTLADLITTYKVNLVGAINEVKTEANSNESKIGNLANLDTTTKADLVGSINEIYKAVIGTVLWSNQNPSQDFGNQTLNIDTSDYDEIEIIYKTSGTHMESSKCELINNAGGVDLLTYSQSRNNWYVRNLGISNNTFTFSDSSIYNIGVFNNTNIPITIIGYNRPL